MADIINIEMHRIRDLEVWTCGACEGERFYLPKGGEECVCADCGGLAVDLRVIGPGEEGA